MQNVSQAPRGKQDAGRYFCRLSHDSAAEELTPANRRLLLASSLRFYLQRISHNIAISADDLLRLVPYTDPPQSGGEGLEAGA